MSVVENNQVMLKGEIVSNFEFSHEVFGERFYVTTLATKRLSEQEDIIRVIVSDRLVDVETEWKGRFVKVLGQFRSYNKHEDRKSHLVLSVFAEKLEDAIEEENGFEYGNTIFLDGYICKPPVYRKTPLGREIADIFLAVNRAYGKSDYIPCIAWGRNAKYAGNLEVATRLRIKGRIQSREYRKRISETESEARMACEVSITKLEVIEKNGGYKN